jgi:hypothetical protein
VTVRGEFMLDRRDGVVDPLSQAAAPLVDPFSLAATELAEPWAGTRRGMYIEGIYRINRSWDTGYRLDRLWAAGSGPYAIDDQTAITVVDGTVDIVSEGHWEQFRP